MTGFGWKVFFCAAAGLMLGLLVYRTQSPHLPMMNSCGVLAFLSMGASLGCLVSEPAAPRR
ncbi:MAG TPA: hypothetical protein VHC22_22090 [Pirellulales bacterium]|nr:hypothetical protein [Pirellulales bacterium]